MYEENENRFSLRDTILQLLLVILFILIMIWLFPTKSYLDNKYVTNENIEETIKEQLEPLYGKLFVQNLETMRDASKDYFTVKKLPSTVGTSVTLTLKEMIEKKMVTEVIDSNNKSCDVDKSYVEVTKMDEDYQMKVQLTCSDYSDYIVVTMGCYDLCNDCDTTTKPVVKPSKPAVTPTPTVKKYSYEYRLDTLDTYSNWSNWSNWSTKKIVANTLTQVETDVKQVIKGYEQVYGIVSYKTETYTDYEVVTNYEEKTNQVFVGTEKKKVDEKVTTVKTDSVAATKKTASGTYSSWKKAGSVTTTNKILYSNDTTSYTLKSVNKVLNCNNSCVYDTIRVYEKQTRTYTAGKTTYSCPANYVLEGTTCAKYETKVEDIYEEVPKYETKTELVPVTSTVAVTKTREVPVYGYKNGNPIYEKVTYYRYRTRTQLTKKGTTYKYSESNNDKTLLEQGYKLTGKKQEIKA